jgi:large conductance mechanosensitive channel
MVKEFRDFLFRGNVIDLAVAVVIGAAFGAVINSLVGDIITPLLGLLGLPDFSTWTIKLNDADPPAVLKPGLFINAIISFVAVALAIFFIVVKPSQAMLARTKKEAEAEAAGPTEIELLTQIRDALKKG